MFGVPCEKRQRNTDQSGQSSCIMEAKVFEMSEAAAVVRFPGCSTEKSSSARGNFFHQSIMFELQR
jgi:hypothetical protein